MKYFIGAVLLIITLSSLCFYWFELRPSKIVSSCSLSALDRAKELEGDREDYEYYFTRCIREKGLTETSRRAWKLE